MSALAKIHLKPAEKEAAHRVASAPEDMVRVKRKLEATSELAVDLVKELFERHVSDNTQPSKDDIAILEHTHSNAMRVFNLGAAGKHLAPLEEPKEKPRGFAGLKVFAAKKNKPPQEPVT